MLVAIYVHVDTTPVYDSFVNLIEKFNTNIHRSRHVLLWSINCVGGRQVGEYSLNISRAWTTTSLRSLIANWIR